MTSKWWKHGHSSASAGLVTTAMSLITMAVGFAFQGVIAAALGISAGSDSFQLAWTIVTFSTVTIFTMVTNFMVPAMHTANPGEIAFGDWWKMPAFGLLLSLAQVGVALVIGLESDTGVILLVSSPSAFFAALGAIPRAVAYMQGRIALASLGPVVNGIVMTLLGLLWHADLSPERLGILLSAAYLVQAVVVSAPLLGRFPTRVKVDSTTLMSFVGVGSFTLLAKFQPVIERMLSVTIAEGAATALGFGQRLAQGILLVASFGLALTATATLTRHLRAKDLDMVAHVLSRTFSGTVLLGSFTVAAALPLAAPVTRLLLERGAFGSSDTQYVVNILILLLPWVLGSSLTGVLTQYLYVERSYRRVAVASIVGISSTVVFTLIFAAITPSFAVAIGSSVASWATFFYVARLVMKSPVYPSLKTQYPHMLALILCASLLILTCLLSFASLKYIFGVDEALQTYGTLTSLAICTAAFIYLRPTRRLITDALFQKI